MTTKSPAVSPPVKGVSCPVLHPAGDRVLLAHGEGARLTRRLVRDIMLQSFDNELLRPLGDAAILPAADSRLVMSTDTYVVSPLFFPGGDIGKLAVHGTLNDLTVCGGQPLYLSLAFVIEEGLPLDTLRRVVGSIREAARTNGVQVVTGDTKVVPRGAADKLFVNTTGVGRLRPGTDLGMHRVEVGDCVLVSGTIGDHGMAVLCSREGLEFESALQSDTASLYPLVQSLFDEGIDAHFLRDPTRGGVSAVLHEVVEGAELSIIIDESALPLAEPVRGACELLGLDPLYVANEGKLIAIVAARDTQRALACMRQHPLGVHAAQIGIVTMETPASVLVRGPLGALRLLDEPSGAPLPRIC